MDLIRRWCGLQAGQAILLLGLLGLAALAGCGDKYKPSLTDDETRKFSAKQRPLAPPVLAVSGETITLDKVCSYRRSKDTPTLGEYLTYAAKNSDSWETFSRFASKQVKARCDVLVLETLLYQQAKREGGDKMTQGLDKFTKTLWREYVVAHGGDEASADAALRGEGMDRKAWEEENKRRSLVRYLVDLHMPKDQPVSHREMLEYYDRMKDTEFAVKPRLTFRLIEIQPARLQVKDPNADRYAEALQLAKDLMARLSAGEDFVELARQYSQDPMAKSSGLWDSVDPQSLAEPYDTLAATVTTMHPGELKGPIEIEGRVFIARLEAKSESGRRPLSEVQAEVERAIIDDRYHDAEERLNAEITERARAGDTGEFVNGCVAEIYRRSREGS